MFSTPSPALLRERFQALFPAALLQGWLRESSTTVYQRLFTPLITLWYLAFQQLSPDHTLAQVLADALQGGADSFCTPHRLLSRGLKSSSTSAYSDARQRLPLAVLQRALQHSAQVIRSGVEEILWRGWNVVLLDGSTVRLRSWHQIDQSLPPHRSSGSQPYWCLARVVTGFCLRTGVALNNAWGPALLSEQVLGARVLGSLPAASLVVADRNFGVFSVVQAAAARGLQIVVRLTGARAGKLARDRKASLRPGLDLSLAWAPTRHDQLDPQLDPSPVPGRLIAVRAFRPGFRTQELYLFTTLAGGPCCSAKDLLNLYGARWQAELHFRSLKADLDLGAPNCRSAAMAEKSWLAGLLAYNLVRSLMVAASSLHLVPIERLSFNCTRKLFLAFLLPARGPLALSLQDWERLLKLIFQSRHPRRSKPRPSEPRAIRRFTSDFPKLKGDRALARRKLRLKS